MTTFLSDAVAAMKSDKAIAGFVNDEFNDLFVAVRMFIASLRDYPGWR